MIDSDLNKRYRFFREHAGYVVGHSAEGALELARAERLLERASDLGVAHVQWMHDDEPYDTGFYTDEEIQAKFDSNEWTGPFGCLLTVDEQVHSLWGIVLGPAELADPYCRVVAAELASEAESDLRQAIGDHLDSRQLQESEV